MSIQINGIDKPKSCFDCPCIDAEFEECAAREHYLLPKDEYGAVLGDVPDWCPITELQTCDDAVSRKAAIEVIDAVFPVDPMKSEYAQGIACGAALAKTYVKHLPSAQQEPKPDENGSEPFGNAEMMGDRTTDECISRQAAIDALMVRDKELRNINWYDKPYAEGECRGIDEALSIVSNLPSVQPQITHCAECIHWKHSDVRKNYCEVFDWMNTADDFCSFAERRTDSNGRD